MLEEDIDVTLKVIVVGNGQVLPQRAGNFSSCPLARLFWTGYPVGRANLSALPICDVSVTRGRENEHDHALLEGHLHERVRERAQRGAWGGQISKHG